MGSIIVATIIGLFVWYTILDNKLTSIKKDINTVNAQIATLANVVSKVDEFKANSKVLEDKLHVIDQLKAKKTGPVIVLDELATAITLVGDVWIKSIKEEDGNMELSMSALRQDKISDFMLALEERSKYFKNVKLLLTEMNKNSGKNNNITYVDFKISCTVAYAADSEKPEEKE